MFLEELTKDLQLEGRQFEAKSRLNREDLVGWLKTIAGFANAEGGDFYIGVEDKTNKLIGFDRREADNERNYFNNSVNEHLVPRPDCNIIFLNYTIKDKERFIIKVHVPESVIRPVVLKYEGVPAIYMRRDGFTNGATYEEIIEMSQRSRNTQYDTLQTDIAYKRADFHTLFEKFEAENSGKKLTDKALKSMGFFDEQDRLCNGAVLFQDSYHGSKTLIQCAVFSGFTRGSERIVSINRFDGNLLASIDFMMEFVRQRMNHSYIKQADSRINIDSYPERALFEGIVNAVAHRDYFLDGTQIQVDMFRDRLEISSPGSFYRGEKIGKTYDLSKIISKRRNELISAVLVSCHMMEAAGTGFDKIIEDYRQADKLHRPYIYSVSDHFTLTLPDLTYSSGLEGEETPNIEFIPPENPTKYDKEILSFCSRQARSIAEIAGKLGLSDSSYFRKKILGNLAEQGYLEKSSGAGKTYYKTNMEMVRDL